MTRDNVISIRLRHDERERLIKRGRPTDVIRGIIAEASAPPLPRGESVGYKPPDVVWFDGSTGRTWPEAVTRR